MNQEIKVRKTVQLYLRSLLVLASFSLASCTTVNMPKIDFMGSDAFSEDVKNIDTSIPDVDEAPPPPTDVRSTKEWDKSANEMISVRDNYVTPISSDEPLSTKEFEAEFEDKKNKVQAYKLDDPVE